jgi:hypothetical protein
MTYRRSAQTTHSPRSSSASWALPLLPILLTVALLAAGCGGSSQPAATTSTAGTPAGSTTATAATLGADELGTQIGTVYVTALKDVALALKDKPDAASVRSQIEQMKNNAITKLVALGHAREAMSTADRAKVDAKITAALSAAGAEDWYATYNEVWTHYSAADTDFANVIAGFNVLGQYANFDLLKKQLPEEAKRLGIE